MAIPTSSTLAFWTIAFAYSSLNRPAPQSGRGGQAGLSRTITRTFGLAGRNTSVAVSDGYHAVFDYDGLDCVTNIRDGHGTVIGTMAYDQLGRRTSLSRANGTSTSYGYDTASRLTSLSHDLAGTANDLTLTFSYNPAGQIVGNTRSNDAYSFTGHTNQNRSDSVNGLNQVTNSGGTAISHDANGNTTSDGSTSYGYDIHNRLVSAAGAHNAMLAYDPLGRLFEVSGGGSTRRFLHDGANLLTENNASGGTLRGHVTEPDTGKPLFSWEGSVGFQRWNFHADERGSIVATSDPAGNPVSINRYDEYGVPQQGNVGRFQYTGQAWIEELGMYHYRARWYHPLLGRFMQTDPIGYGDGMNLYAYVGGDPVNRRDPSGTCYVENWSMHIYDSRGNDLGPDPIKPERWAVLVGCDFDRGIGGGARGPFEGSLGGGGGRGVGGSRPSPSEQRQACSTNSYINEALRDSDVQRATAAARGATTSHVSPFTGDRTYAEHGFWISRDLGGRGFTPWPLLTDHLSREIPSAGAERP